MDCSELMQVLVERISAMVPPYKLTRDESDMFDSLLELRLAYFFELPNRTSLTCKLLPCMARAPMQVLHVKLMKIDQMLICKQNDSLPTILCFYFFFTKLIFFFFSDYFTSFQKHIHLFVR